jgi:hypothetical protein
VTGDVPIGTMEKSTAKEKNTMTPDFGTMAHKTRKSK